MVNFDDIHHRLKVSNLQAKRELIEINRAALLREVRSPLTSQDRREEVFALCDELMIKWAKIVEELNIHEGKVKYFPSSSSGQPGSHPDN
jgi:hypothetical protein